MSERSVPDDEKRGLAEYRRRGDGLTPRQKKRKLGAWRKAYIEGDDTHIKRDAGDLMGRLYVKAREMLAQIERDGLTLQAPVTNRFGDPIEVVGPDGVRDYVWETKAHPLIASLATVLRLMKIDLHEFMLTPLAQGVGNPTMEGGIKNTSITIEELHVHQNEQFERFREALKLADKLRNADPVYREHMRQEQQQREQAALPAPPPDLRDRK